ncbi:hypothetical protein D3C86_1401580 [compost metagenome]
MVGQNASGPAIGLFQRHRRRAEAPLLAAEQLITAGRYQQRRAAAEYPATVRGLGRREEKTLGDIAGAGFVRRAIGARPCWSMIGRMVREMRFQSSFKANGSTGWILVKLCMPSPVGPIFWSQLY